MEDICRLTGRFRMTVFLQNGKFPLLAGHSRRPGRTGRTRMEPIGKPLRQSAFGVELITKVDAYRTVERSLKYGILFFVLVFTLPHDAFNRAHVDKDVGHFRHGRSVRMIRFEQNAGKCQYYTKVVSPDGRSTSDAHQRRLPDPVFALLERSRKGH